MAGGGDDDLLARLNALKPSHIDLKAQKITDLPQPGAVDPSSSFSNDITARLRALSPNSSSPAKNGTPLDVPELQNESNDKTVEELLSELGREEQWKPGANEAHEIESLLKEARSLLPEQESTTEDHGAGDDAPERQQSGAIGVSAFAPEPESPQREDAPADPSSTHIVTEDQEADELLQRILDEIGVEEPLDAQDPTIPQQPGTPSQDTPKDPSPPSYSSHHFPQSPSSDPPPSDLDSRFASLTLPSVPTSLPTAPSTLLPSTPTTKPGAKPPNHTEEEEEDQYCIICFANPTVRCLGSGCDGDLYCDLCWREGHVGEDVGREMRRHKALRLNQGEGGGDKEEKKKVLVRRPKGRLVGA